MPIDLCFSADKALTRAPLPRRWDPDFFLRIDKDSSYTAAIELINTLYDHELSKTYTSWFMELLFDKRYTNDFQSVKLHNRYYPCMNNPIGLCKQMYGDDWYVPNPSWAGGGKWDRKDSRYTWTLDWET